MFAAAAMSFAAGAQTFETNLVDFSSDKLEGYETSVFMFGGEPCKFRTSDNGLYAVGVEYETFHSSFMWTRATNTVEWLSPKTSDKTDKIVIAYDVANDGTIAGAVVDEDNELHPAIKRPGSEEWILMPMPEGWYTKWNYKYPDYSSVARYISPDGKVVCGYVNYLMPEDERLLWYPVVWKLDENDNVVETIEYTDQYMPNAFLPYDMSDDGSVIVGMGENYRGEQLPVMFKDGKYIFLAGPELVECAYNAAGYFLKDNGDGTYTAYDFDVDFNYWVEVETDDYEVFCYVLRELDENGLPVADFWIGGCATALDDDMNVYYYYGDGTGENYYIVENLITGEKKYYDEIIACGTRDMRVGKGHIVEGPQVDISSLSAALNVADDATCFAGVRVGSADGNQFNTPALIWLTESPFGTSAVESIDVFANHVSVAGNVLSIEGSFDRAELFNVNGQKLADVASGYDLSLLSAGIYVVKVQNNGATYVQKIAK